MHTQELVLQHALGIRERTRRGEAFDEFKEGKELTKKVKKLCSNLLIRKWSYTVWYRVI
jgi:hypothetical protein